MPIVATRARNVACVLGEDQSNAGSAGTLLSWISPTGTCLVLWQSVTAHRVGFAMRPYAFAKKS